MQTVPRSKASAFLVPFSKEACGLSPVNNNVLSNYKININQLIREKLLHSSSPFRMPLMPCKQMFLFIRAMSFGYPISPITALSAGCISGYFNRPRISSSVKIFLDNNHRNLLFEFHLILVSSFLL